MHGHPIDLVITKGLNVSTNVMDLALSHHYCTLFDVSLMSPYFQNWSRTVGKRVINENCIALFEQALSRKPPQTSDSVNDLMNNLTSKLKQIIDDIAQVKVKKFINKQSAPWRKNPMVKQKKRECRKAERKMA